MALEAATTLKLREGKPVKGSKDTGLVSPMYRKLPHSSAPHRTEGDGEHNKHSGEKRSSDFKGVNSMFLFHWALKSSTSNDQDSQAPFALVGMMPSVLSGQIFIKSQLPGAVFCMTYGEK